MNYKDIEPPDYIYSQNDDPNRHSAKSLRQLGEILAYLYKLAESPFFYSWKGFEDVAPLNPANQSVPEFERLNRTLIERTINEATVYHKVEYNNKVRIINSRSFVESLQNIYDISQAIKAILELDDVGIELNHVSIQLQRIQYAGYLTAHLYYFMDTCMDEIIANRIILYMNKVAERKDNDSEKLLRRELTDLENAKQYQSPKVYSQLTEYLKREIKFYSDNTTGDAMKILVELVKEHLRKREGTITTSNLLRHLAVNDYPAFMRTLEEYIQTVFSSYDIFGREQEREYHIILTTVLSHVDTIYEVSSNREAGTGRYDILLKPRGEDFLPIIFELKKLTDTKQVTVDNTLQVAFSQIKARNYAIILKQEGFSNYIAIAAAFSGKNVYMKHLEFLVS